MAWISSIITVSTSARMSPALDVNIKYRLSGVVIKISGGWRTCLLRSALVVSPDRTPTRTSGTGCPKRSPVRPIPNSGARRLFSTSTPNAFNGDTYSTRTPVPLRADAAVGGASISDNCPGADTREFNAHKNAASVLPEPVGATTNACSPAEIASHAPC